MFFICLIKYKILYLPHVINSQNNMKPIISFVASLYNRNIMKKIWCLLAIVLAFGFYSCSSDSPELPGEEPIDNPVEPDGDPSDSSPVIDLTDGEKLVVGIQNDFAYGFFAAVEESCDENIFISPVSLSMCLSLVSNGAEGSTKTQIISALGCDPENLESLNSLNSKLLSDLPSIDEETIVELSNSIWADDDFEVKQSFIDSSMDIYNAEYYVTDMWADESVDAINGWCDKKTHGLIKGITKNPLKICIFFMNATYFKGCWSKEFDKENTVKESFRNNDGTVSTVEMMNQYDQFSYAETGNMKLIRLPYGNGTYSMCVALSDDEISADDVRNAFENAIMGTYKVKLKMPRLDIKTQTDAAIQSFLRSLGVEDVFNPLAVNLSGINDECPAISSIRQSAAIKVDEQGTEAAAVNSVDMWADVNPAAIEEREFYMNKPFSFFIQENNTGVILFMGKVVKL